MGIVSSQEAGVEMAPVQRSLSAESSTSTTNAAYQEIVTEPPHLGAVEVGTARQLYAEAAADRATCGTTGGGVTVIFRIARGTSVIFCTVVGHVVCFITQTSFVGYNTDMG